MNEKVKRIGEMRFCLDDFRNSKFNESADLTLALYGKEDDELMSIETYWSYCRYFAAAMGFGEKTIAEWFGGL